MLRKQNPIKERSLIIEAKIGHRKLKVPFLVASVILVMLLAYAPLAYLVAIGQISNSRGYRTLSYSFYGNVDPSQGFTKVTNGTVTIGNVDYGKSSWATWTINYWVNPFVTEQLRNATSAYVIIKGDLPLTEKSPTVNVTQVGWTDENFTGGWVAPAGNTPLAAISDGDILDLQGNFTIGTRNAYLFKKDFPVPINTSQYPYVIVRWRSTAHVGGVTAVGLHWPDNQIVVDSPKGTIGYGGAYSPNWTLTIQKLPPNNTINAIVMAADSGEYADSVSGVQHVYVDYVSIGSIEVNCLSTHVLLNGQPVFKGNLTLPKNNTYTLQSSDSNRIPIDYNSLTVENRLNVTVDGYTSWNITSVWIVLSIDTSETFSPAWQSVSYFKPMFLAVFGVEMIISLVAFNKFRKWLNKRAQ
jgi:hypothetical protein